MDMVTNSSSSWVTKTIKFTFTSILCFSVFVGAAIADERPNVIVIFTDDHGYADLGAQNILSDLKTPNLDALANEGVRMTDGYASAPQCVPSRGGLLSGQYQNRFGLESNNELKRAEIQDKFREVKTVPERLQEVGYTTGMAGKWHLGRKEEIGSHGFDSFFHKNSNRPGYWNMNLEGKVIPPQQQNSGGYHLTRVGEFAAEFIKRNKENPFFFYAAFRAPHVPLDPPEEFLSRFPGEMPERRRKALAMLSAVDDSVGHIMSTLRDLELEEKTLIFVIGDNGAPLKIHKLDKKGNGSGWDGSLNTPLNGEKGMLAEGGIRTPYLAYWKGVLPPGTIYQHPVIAMDATATAAALAGIPESVELDGKNLIPHLTGSNSNPPHDSLYWRWLGQAAIRQGDWKYLASDNRSYLFDIRKDPEEKNNLIMAKPELAKKMRADLEVWTESLLPQGIGAITSEKMRRQSEKFYSWYLDGERDL